MSKAKTLLKWREERMGCWRANSSLKGLAYDIRNGFTNKVWYIGWSNSTLIPDGVRLSYPTLDDAKAFCEKNERRIVNNEKKLKKCGRIRRKKR